MNDYTKNLKIAKQIASIMLKIRELSKQLNTYYELNIEKDGCVRGNFQAVVSDTGRTSCNKPPLQTQPKSSDSKVREHFTSRYKNGLIVCADFSQLEVCVQAELSKDQNYKYDLIDNKMDLHCKWLARKEQKTYEEVYDLCKVKCVPEWETKRSNIKAVTFSRNYRAQPGLVAKNANLPIETILEMFKQEREEYPKLEEFNENLRRQVESLGGYRSFTGKTYKFKQKKYFDKEYDRWNKYRYPEIVNYMVQGTATDIAIIMLGKFWRERALFNRNKYLMWNFVHDEIDFDCKKEYIQQLKQDCDVLTIWKYYAKLDFNYDWNIDLKVNISEGNSWYEAK